MVWAVAAALARLAIDKNRAKIRLTSRRHHKIMSALFTPPRATWNPIDCLTDISIIAIGCGEQET